MKTKGWGVAVVGVLCALPGIGATGLCQQKKEPSQPIVKISAELVQTDVLVRDKSNKPVSGLRREDFEIYDNGKLQVITNFAFEADISRSLSGSDADVLRSLPKAITASEVRRVIAFVVDTLHMKPENVYRTRQMLEEFIDHKMEPGDLVLIIPTAGGSGLLQQFTSDQQMLRSAVDRLRPFIFSNDTTPYRSTGRNTLGTSITNGQSSVGQMPGDASQSGPARRGGRRGATTGLRMPQVPNAPMNNVDPVEETDVRNTLFTLDNLIDAMRRLPGRKLAVLVSEGFRLAQTQTTDDMRETTDLAGRAGVVFYTIDPRGLDPLMVDASDDLSSQAEADGSGAPAVGDFMNQKRSDYYESQDSLNALAADTGGRFFHDNNEIKTGLDSMLVENDSYYVLGFQPDPSKWDGKYHRLKVVVAGRPDLVIQWRAGYLARNEKTRTEASANTLESEDAEAINSPLVRRDIDLRLTPFYKDDPKMNPSLMTVFRIDAGKLHFKLADGRYKDRLEIVGFMLDGSGKQVDGFKDNLELNLLPKTYETTLKDGLLSTRTLSVKPGRYQMRVLVREAQTGLLGTANNYIEVPDLKTDRLTMSSIFMMPDTKDPGQAGDATAQTATLAERRFKRGGTMNYLFVVYHGEAHGGKTDFEMQSRILKNGRAVFTGPLRPLQTLSGSTPPGRIVSGGALSVGRDLAPNDYTLEVTVEDKLAKRDKRVVAKQEIDFRVE